MTVTTNSPKLSHPDICNIRPYRCSFSITSKKINRSHDSLRAQYGRRTRCRVDTIRESLYSPCSASAILIDRNCACRIVTVTYPCGGLRGSLPGVHESMDLVRCICGQPIAATLLVASKMSLRLWPPTEHQCVLIYKCVFTHVCCWLFSVGNKVTTTTTNIR